MSCSTESLITWASSKFWIISNQPLRSFGGRRLNTRNYHQNGNGTSGIGGGGSGIWESHKDQKYIIHFAGKIAEIVQCELVKIQIFCMYIRKFQIFQSQILIIYKIENQIKWERFTQLSPKDHYLKLGFNILAGVQHGSKLSQIPKRNVFLHFTRALGIAQ